MNVLFKKLNFKNQPSLLIVNVPENLHSQVKEMEEFATIESDPLKVADIEFALVFVTRQDEINRLVTAITPKLKGDAIVWFSYPKGSSKKYKCDFNRDKGWDIMGEYGLEGVRQVSVDDDWSALRFRKVKFIKTISRSQSMALTQEAKSRTTQKITK